MSRYKKKEWSGELQKILVAHLEGKTHTEIAGMIGKSIGVVSRKINSKKFQARLESVLGAMTDQVRDYFKLHALSAAEQIVKIAKKGQGKDRMKFEASKEVLYQVGCKPKEIVETVTREYTTEEITSALITLKEVEHITDKLKDSNSRFVIDVNKEHTDNKEDLVQPQEHNEYQETTSRTGQDRQEDVST